MYVAADKVMLEPDDKAALAGKVAVPKVVTHVDDPVSTTDERFVFSVCQYAIKVY